MHVYRLFVNINGHLEMLYAIDTLSNYAHLNCSCNTALVLHVLPQPFSLPHAYLLNNASTPVMYMYYSWESWWVDGLIMKRVRGGGGEAHENCMGPTLPLVQASLTVHTYTEYNSTLHVQQDPLTP